MPLNFDAAFGLHEQALLYRGERSAVIAHNIANADTPNFKARDMLFRDVLKVQADRTPQGLLVTDKKHMQMRENAFAPVESYEIPGQPNIDGNTVETQREQAKFAENALQFQASLTLLNGKMRGLMSAIRGE